MRVKNFFKRISVFFLVFVLLFCVVFFSFNKAKTVKAVVPLAIGGAAALLFSALAAGGISFTFSNLDSQGLSDMADDVTSGYSSGGKTWSDWKNDYSNEDGTFNWSTLFVDKQTQSTYAVYSNEFIKWLHGLYPFVTNKYNLSSSPSGIAEDSYLQLPSGRVSLLPSNVTTAGDARFYNCIPDQDGVFDFQIKSDFFYRVGVETNDRYPDYPYHLVVQMSSDNTNWTNLNSVYAQNYFVFAFARDNNGDFGICAYWNKNTADASVNPNSLLYRFPAGNYEVEDIGLSGSLTDGYSDLQDALDNDIQDKISAGYGDTYVGEVDLGRVDGITLEQKIQNLINRILSNTGSIAGTGVGVLDNDDVYEDDEDVQKVPTAGELGNNIILVNGLEDFFPFCIPFDLYEIINLLNVPAEAPQFNWKMDFGGRFDDYDILIDLTPYNTVAAIFRTMIIIVFLIFLTLKTRDLIRG